MEKTIITFSANEQCLQKTSGIYCYASNIVSYIEAHFDLGANWSGYDSVRAVWSNDNNMTVISTVLDSNGVCVVPFEVLKTKGVVKVNLVGSISVSDVLTDRLTTFPCEAVKVTAKAKIEGSETQPITPSQFEQFVTEVKADADRAETVRDEAEAARDVAVSAKDTAVNAVEGFEDIVDTATATAVQTIQGEGATQVTAIQTEGTTQVASVRTEGSTQVTAVQDKGDEVLDSIPADYTQLSQNVTDLKSDFDAITSDAMNLVDLSDVQLGKNWLNQSVTGRAILYIEADPSTEYRFEFPVNSNFTGITCIQKPYEASGTNLKSTSIPNGGKINITTESNTRVFCVQFEKGSVEITLAMFEDYAPYICKGATIVNTAIDKSARKSINDISETQTNLADMDNLQIGKNWVNQTNTARAILYVSVDPMTTYHLDFPYNSHLLTIDAVQKPSSASGTNLRSTTIPNGGSLTLTTEATAGVICIQFGTGTIVTTAGMFADYEPFVGKGTYKDTAIDRGLRNLQSWRGKKLVWLGTSIPAAGKYDIDNPKSYPIMVGDLLGATVYNEAVGSSALHCKDPARINANNPYGFLDNFEAVSRCITNSSEEMEWIIEHFNDANVFTTNVPASLSNDDKDFIRSCSWEVKLQKYFNASDFPDAWIIDHGHNDIPSVASEATYTAKESISGTQHNGYYSAGNFVESTASSYIEYDVTDELYVWISGTFGAWYDVYDIYDSDGNNIGFTRNATQTQVNALRVNVSNATTLRVSNINTLINTIGVEKLKYPTYNSLYSYNGAFDFIVNKILTYNPRARIIMIGEYENQKYPSISENQLIASQRWEFPLYKQWENLGWSQQPILVDGEYKSMLNIIIPDNLHPHTDTTGYALHQMANNIVMWLNTIA